jgi:hypothetical protein
MKKKRKEKGRGEKKQSALYIHWLDDPSSSLGGAVLIVMSADNLLKPVETVTDNLDGVIHFPLRDLFFVNLGGQRLAVTFQISPARLCIRVLISVVVWKIDAFHADPIL